MQVMICLNWIKTDLNIPFDFYTIVDFWFHIMQVMMCLNWTKTDLNPNVILKLDDA